MQNMSSNLLINYLTLPMSHTTLSTPQLTNYLLTLLDSASKASAPGLNLELVFTTASSVKSIVMTSKEMDADKTVLEDLITEA